MNINSTSSTTPIKLKLTIKYNVWLFLLTLIGVIATIGYYVHSIDKVANHISNQFTTISLADQLRHTSDDLTHTVRSYVITGEKRYKLYFQEILDIRDGKSPRPTCLNHAYWELITKDGQRPCPYGPPIALLELMNKTGIKDHELNLLKQSKAASDALTKIEFAAIAMVESNPNNSQIRLQAIHKLHDATYQQAKTKIMDAIAKFHNKLEQRTQKEITQTITKQKYATYALIIISTLAGFLLWRLLYALSQEQQLRKSMQREQDLAMLLIESEHRFRLMTTNIKDYAIIMLDAHGQVNSWNIGAEKIKGYKQEEIIGQHLSIFYPLDDVRANKPSLLLKQAQKQGHVEDEGWRIRKDGSRFYANVTITPTYDENKKLIGFAKITKDITRRKVAEQALLDSEARFRQLLETSPLPMLVTSPPPESRILFMNKRFVNMFGYSKQDIWDVSSWWPHAYPDPEYRAKIQQRWAAAIAAMKTEGTQYIHPVDAKVTCKDNSIRYIEVHMAVLSENRGAIIVFNDFTERKHIEQALTIEKDKAKAASRAKSDFLANMSHEIRTPMNAVMGLAQLLMETDLNNYQRNYLTKMIQASQSLLGLLNDILDYSKIEANKLDLEAVDVCLNDLIANSTNLFSLVAEDKNLKLIFDIDPKLPPVLIGDPLRLKQIINNLLGNAIKFTHRGQVSLTIKSLNLQDNKLERPDNKVTLQITVSDTGIGMIPEQINKLFHAFEQGDASTTREFGGTGLGLAIVKRLITMMDGTIKVSSTPNQGSIFDVILSLPVSPTITNRIVSQNADQQEFYTIEELRQQNPNVLQSIQGAKILLVEDNDINQLIAQDILQNMGLRVTTANNGREAIEQVAIQHYDAILMDVQMPEMDGLEATRLIRANPKFRDMPIIAMTAAAMLSDQKACQDVGMNDFIPKPVAIETLVTVLLRRIQTVSISAIDINNSESNTINANTPYQPVTNPETELNTDVSIGSTTQESSIVQERLKLLLEDIQSSIIQKKYVCTTILDEIESGLTKTPYVAQFGKLRNHLEEFNYNLAQEDLINLTLQCNIVINNNTAIDFDSEP